MHTFEKMKRFLSIFLLLAVMSFATLHAQRAQRVYRVEDIPNVQVADRTRFVSNPDGLLSPQAVYRIDTMLYALKESGKAQVAVVAVNSIGDETPFDFLQQLVTSWGVGRKDTDDGLGVLLVVDQGAIEIQTGYGLEGDLPDALLKRIINNYMLPAFREGDWDAGMINGLAAISEVLNGRTPADLSSGKEGAPWIMILLFFGIPILIVILALIFAGRCPRCHKKTLKRVDTQVISKNREETVVEDTYVCQNCGYVMKKRHTDHHGGGAGGMIIGGGIGGMLGGLGGRGGGFGGGGGGFGGGGFGGGGARGGF